MRLSAGGGVALMQANEKDFATLKIALVDMYAMSRKV